MNRKEEVQGFCISGKSACVVGCGGLGCNIAVHLVGAGIGKLILCDFDKITESNLNRQFLYTKNDIGKSKCDVLKKRLSDFSQDTEIEGIDLKIETESDMQFAKGCDIILLAVDNIDARKAVQDFAAKNRIPLVCGGIDGFYGMAYLYVPDYSPCPDCAGLNIDSQTKYNISATAGIIGSAQSALAIKYLLTENKQLAGKILIYDEDIFDTLKITPSKHCEICKNYPYYEVIK